MGLPFRILVFVVGAASMAGQVSWSRLAASVVGGTFAAWAITLFGAMAGLSLGAAWAGLRRFRLPAVLGIAGLTLMAMPFVILQVSRLEGMPLARMVLTGALLCAAHLPFGAFLPTLVVEGKNVGRLYGLASMGGVIGALAAGEFLSRWIALDLLGLLLGGIVAGSMILVGRQSAEIRSAQVAGATLPWPLLLTAFALGLLGLVSESLWMRVLGFYWESNTLCFALVTASTVAGLSSGAWIAARLSLGVALGGAAVSLAGAASLSPMAVDAFGIPARLGLTLLLVGLPAAMSGATFILLLGRMKGGAGRAVGFLSGANSAGAAAGPLILLAGGQWVAWPSQLHVLIAAGYAALMGAFVGRRYAPAGLGLAAALGLWSWTMSAGPAITDYHRTAQTGAEFDTVTMPYLKPSLESTVAVTRDTRTGTEIVWIDRGFQGDTSPLGRRIPERLGRIPCSLLGRAPRKAMVIGMGTGITLRAIAESGAPDIDVAELSRGVIDANRTILADVNGNVLSSPSVRVRHGDGRPLLLDAKEPYDLIVADMMFPTVLGAGNLFSREFYDLARRRLTADGLFVQWVPCFLLSPEDLSAVVGAFTDIFPGGSAWIGHLGPDRLILGLAGGRAFGTYALGPGDLRKLAGGVPPIRDADPRMESRSRESGEGRFGLANLKRVIELMEARADPTNCAWLAFAKAELATDRGTAAALYREAARVSPGTTDAEIELSRLNFQKSVEAARRAARTNDADLMIDSLRRAAAQESLSVGNLYLADALVASGQYREAAMELAKAVAKAPRSADARFKLAMISEELGDGATARREFGIASALRKEHPTSRLK